MMAAEANVTLAAELNKLRKDELIEILITRKVPHRVTSDIVIKFVQKYNCICQVKTSDSSDANMQSLQARVNNNGDDTSIPASYANTAFIGSMSDISLNSAASQLSQLENTLQSSGEGSAKVINDLLRENTTLKNENDLLRQLQTERVERIELLCYKIRILENSGVSSNNGAYSLSTNSLGNGSIGAASAIKNVSNQIAEKRNHSYHPGPPAPSDGGAKELVTTQHGATKSDKRKRYVLGTCKEDSCILKPASTDGQFTALHIFNLDVTTTEGMVVEHVTTLLDARSCASSIKAEKLRTNGLYSSFKLTVPRTLAESLLSPELWPENVKVRFFQRSPRQTQSYRGGRERQDRVNLTNGRSR